ncbi:MAG TPA: hemerythrin domain-containing protein [Telmatospirillum sp.]|nr:hemerythrin domain-containing protein [Telmatospirillum sp.]
MTYAHYADIISFNVLAQMTTADASVPGITPDVADKVRRDYLEPADLKKIDIGGGLIHGSAEDFAKDGSRKIILAHTALEFSNAQRKIGSGAPFGTVDVLIPSVRDYAIGRAYNYLNTYFPEVPLHDLDMLLNRPIIDINAETIVLRQGDCCDVVTMPLTGLMEVVNNDSDSRYILSAGALIGESACLDDRIAAKTYRAASFVKAITWPADLYRNFIETNQLMDSALATVAMRSVFARTHLFGENISIPVMNQLVRAASILSLDSGETVSEGADCLFLIRSGTVERQIEGTVAEMLEAGDFFGETMVLQGRPPVGSIVVHKTCDLVVMPGAMLRDIPIVRWKLFETYLRRLRLPLLSPGKGAVFSWNGNYAVGIPLIDRQHQKLFEIANRVIQAIDLGQDADIRERMIEFLEYSDYHLAEEMSYMEKMAFPETHSHAISHKKIINDIFIMRNCLESSDVSTVDIDKFEFSSFFKSWVDDHIVKEDRKIFRYLQNGYAE